MIFIRPTVETIPEYTRKVTGPSDAIMELFEGFTAQVYDMTGEFNMLQATVHDNGENLVLEFTCLYPTVYVKDIKRKGCIYL